MSELRGCLFETAVAGACVGATRYPMGSYIDRDIVWRTMREYRVLPGRGHVLDRNGRGGQRYVVINNWLTTPYGRVMELEYGRTAEEDEVLRVLLAW